MSKCLGLLRYGETMMSSRIDEAIEVATWIKDPSRFHKHIFREEPYPYQKVLLEDLAKLNPKRIMCCAAGSTGKTKILASHALYACYLFPLIYPKIFPYYRVVIVSGSEEQSRTLYEYIKFAIEENPIINKAVKDTLKTVTLFKNKSTIRALPKSFKAIYGKHCLSSDTQVLTDNGWKYFYNLDKSDKIATLNKKHKLEFQSPIRYYKHKHRGWMIRLSNKYIDIMSTANHKHYIKSQWKYWHLTETTNLPIRFRLKKSCKWNGLEKKYFIIPEYNNKYHNKIYPRKKIKMDLWLKFLGFYISEGYVDSTRISIAQKDTSIYTKEIVESIKDLGYIPRISKVQIRFSCPQLSRYLKTLGRTAFDKFIPKDIKQLCSRQLTILLDSLMKGDGTIRKNSRVFNSSSKKLINDISEIILKVGKSPQFYILPEKLKYFRKNDKSYLCKESYQVSILNRDEIRFSRFLKNKKERIYYNDYVYCVEVPNHIIYVKRNGKCCWTGNSDLVTIDEAVEAGDFVIRDAFRIIAESPNSRIIMSSTPHEYTSLFVDMWDNKKKYPDYNPILKEVGSWKRYSWSSFDCPRITQDMIKEAQKDLPGAMFNIYWLGKPYPLIGTMISIEKIKACVTTNNIKYDKNGASPIIGVDWGTFPNPTAIVLVQKDSDGIYNLISSKTFLRARHPAILDWIDAKARSFGVSNIFTDSTDKGENLRLREKGLPVREISFKKEKPIMQSNLLNIFEKENIRINENEVKLLWQLKKYRYDTKLDEDLVDALMLACRMGDRRASKMYYKFIKPDEAKKRFIF